MEFKIYILRELNKEIIIILWGLVNAEVLYGGDDDKVFVLVYLEILDYWVVNKVWDLVWFFFNN